MSEEAMVEKGVVGIGVGGIGATTNNQGNQQPAETIYQQYQPANVTELREYILFTICKKLKKQFKKNQSLLGPGHVNHLSNKLINYL